MKAYSTAILALILGWLTVSQSAAAAVLIKLPPEEIVYHVTEVGNHLWVATDAGAYRLDGASPTLVGGKVAVLTIAEVDARVWLGSIEGLLRVEGEKAESFLIDPDKGIGIHRVTTIQSDGHIAWVGTDAGLYRVENNNVSSRFLDDQWIETVAVSGQDVWVGTDTNVYHIIDSQIPIPVFEQPRRVTSIALEHSTVWLVAKNQLGRGGSCYQFQKGSKPVKRLSGHEVIAINVIDGEAWFATTRGVFRQQDGFTKSVSIEDLREPVNTISRLGGDIWIGTSKRAYRQVGERFVPIPQDMPGTSIRGFIETSHDEIWAWGENGLFRFDEDVDLWVQPATRQIFGLQVVLGSVVGITEIRYNRAGQNPYVNALQQRFMAILDSNEKNFKKRLAENNYVLAKDLKQDVPYGFQKLYVLVRDEYGNTTSPPPLSVLVLPKVAVIAILIPVAFLLVILLRRSRASID